MMANGGMEEWLHSFSTLALYRTQLSASCPSCFTPSTQTLPVKVKKKVKFSRYRPDEAQRVGRGIALHFHDCSTRRG